MQATCSDDHGSDQDYERDRDEELAQIEAGIDVVTDVDAPRQTFRLRHVVDVATLHGIVFGVLTFADAGLGRLRLASRSLGTSGRRFCAWASLRFGVGRPLPEVGCAALLSTFSCAGSSFLVNKLMPIERKVTYRRSMPPAVPSALRFKLRFKLRSDGLQRTDTMDIRHTIFNPRNTHAYIGSIKDYDSFRSRRDPHARRVGFQPHRRRVEPEDRLAVDFREGHHRGPYEAFRAIRGGPAARGWCRYEGGAVAQSRRHAGRLGGHRFQNVSEDAPTVLLYAHHDGSRCRIRAYGTPTRSSALEIDTRLYGRGAADDGGGIAIHSGALKRADDLKVNIKVFIEGEEEMGSPSFIPFIEEHRDEFASDAIIVADSGNWSAEIPSLTTSLRGNTDIDVHVKALEHPVHSGQYGGPILDANTLAAMLISSMYDANGDLAMPGVASEEPVGGLQRDMDEATVRADAGIVESYRLAGTGSLAARLWTKPSVTVIGFDAHPVEGSFNVISPETTFRLSLRTAPNQRPEEAQEALADSWWSMRRSVPSVGRQARQRHGLGHGSER